VVAYSREFCVAVQLLSGAGLLFLFGRSLVESLATLLTGQLRSAGNITAQVPATPELIAEETGRLARGGFSVVLPWLAVLFLAAVLAGLGQVGFLLLPNRMLPQVSRLSPAGGFRRVFSGSNLAGAGLNLLRLSVLLAVTALYLFTQLALVVSLVRLSAGQAALMIGGLVAELSLILAICSIVYGAADYGWQRWKHEQALRMTPEEFRQEMRDAQADPQFRRMRQSTVQSQTDSSVTPLAQKGAVETIR